MKTETIITRTLANSEKLTIETTEENGVQYYKARVSSDKENLGFEGDNGEIKEGETLDKIADEIEIWLNDNINS